VTTAVFDWETGSEMEKEGGRGGEGGGGREREAGVGRFTAMFLLPDSSGA
jgi:hypothetical protein